MLLVIDQFEDILIASSSRPVGAVSRRLWRASNDQLHVRSDFPLFLVARREDPRRAATPFGVRRGAAARIEAVRGVRPSVRAWNTTRATPAFLKKMRLPPDWVAHSALQERRRPRHPHPERSQGGVCEDAVTSSHSEALLLTGLSSALHPSDLVARSGSLVEPNVWGAPFGAIDAL